MKRILITVVTVFCITTPYAQTDVELEQQLQGKTSFYEIKNIVTNYFAAKQQALSAADVNKRKAINRQEKFWNRWLYENESRLDAKGDIMNFNAASYKAFEEVQEKMKSISPADRSAFGEWQFMGPSSSRLGIGRVNRLAFDPIAANTVYAGSANGGIWKTTNGGTSWQSLAGFVPSLGVSGLVVSHNNPQEIYVLTGDGDARLNGGFQSQWGYAKPSVGVLKSADGGATWFRIGKFRRSDGSYREDNVRYFGLNLVQSPVQANTLIAATDSGLYRTTDGGVNWNQCMVGDFSNNTFFDVAFKPGSSLEIYATGSNGFFKSADGGSSFTQVNIPEFIDNAGANISGRIKIAVSAANPSLVYLLAGPGFLTEDNDDDRYLGFFRSLNSGASFTRRHNSPDLLAYTSIVNTFKHQSVYDLALAANPSNANMAVTGGLVAWRTEDGGADFSEIVDYFSDPDNSNYIHPDIHDLAFNPLNGKLWAATDGGVCSSTDNGDSWSQHFNMPITQFYHFEPSNDDNLIWGGSQDNGVLEQSVANSTIFDDFTDGDGYDVLTDVENRDDVYYVVNKEIRTDGGPSIEPDNMPDDNSRFFPLLAMHPTNETIIYAGFNKLFQSFNDGITWREFADNNGDSVAARWALTTSNSNADRLYCAGRNYQGLAGIWRLNAATTLFPTATQLISNFPWMGQKITDIAISPVNSSSVTITFGGYEPTQKVLHSEDGGSTWVNWSYDLPNVPVNTVITDAAGNMYIGTDIGVYYSNNSITGWQPFYNNLPPVTVSELAFHNVGNIQYIYAATFGRGIWRSEIFQNCDPDITVNQPLQGQQFFQASNSVTSASNISGGTGTRVQQQGGNHVTLTDGFTANYGSSFQAYIAPCNSGLPPVLQKIAVTDSVTNKTVFRYRHFVFGKIAGISNQNDSAQITLQINKPGIYKAVLVNRHNEVVSSIFSGEDLQAGKKVYTIYTKEIASLPKGFYMLQLFYGTELVHQQELFP